MQDEDEWMEVSDIVERIARATADDAEFVRNEIIKLLRVGQIAGRSADTREMISASDWDGVSLSRSGAAVVPVVATVSRHQIELRVRDVLHCWMKWAAAIITPLPRISARPACAPTGPEFEVEIKSGYPGKPTSRHLVEAEFRQRWSTGERHASLAEWARALHAWIKLAHPSAPTPKPKTIENHLRPLLRECKAEDQKQRGWATSPDITPDINGEV